MTTTAEVADRFGIRDASPLDCKPAVKAAIEALRKAQDEIETAHAGGHFESPGYVVGPGAHVPPTVAAITSTIAQLKFWAERLQWAYDMGYLPGGRHNPALPLANPEAQVIADTWNDNREERS